MLLSGTDKATFETKELKLTLRDYISNYIVINTENTF